MLKFILFIVRLFKNPIQWLGVDFSQFEILLRTKLTLDNRSGSTSFQSSGSKKRTLLSQFFLFLAYSFLIGIISFSIGDIMLSTTILFAIIMVTLSMTLISEFTIVLFDHRDNYILLPRPINSRTLLMLRLVHIQLYMGFIAYSLALIPGIMLALKYNWIAVLIYFLAVGLSSWLTLIFTTFVYLLISKTVEGERFKDIITYAQVILAVLMFTGYQLVPRLIDTKDLSQAVMSVHWWTYIFSPAWLAALVKLSLLKDITLHVILLSGLAILVPVTGAWYLVKILSAGFENILGQGSSETATIAAPKTLKSRETGRIIRLFFISGIEKAGWDLAMATTGRDRKFKQSVYPYFGMMLVFAIVIFKPDLHNITASLQEKSEFTKYLAIMIIGYSGSVAILQLPYTDIPEAAWIYRALPLKLHGHLLTGAVKAMLFRFFIPVYILVTILSLWLWGFSIFPQVILGGMSIVLLMLIIIILQKMELPFTQKREMQQKGTNTIMVIMSMILMFLSAGLLYITSIISGWITFLICLSVAGLIVFMFRIIRSRIYV